MDEDKRKALEYCLEIKSCFFQSRREGKTIAGSLSDVGIKINELIDNNSQEGYLIAWALDVFCRVFKKTMEDVLCK